ncbi:hypothetical protein ALI144C_44055 [Actinosynnema sp. ALI-1.44]|uniref:hypothetical protein n=1 Tax=Actinosynnema sp. ALI-1.44 TaxID=1933779 RepID=UPI00097BCB11|nr:hypothetical protein [Actinosynnema sp. ALI-1.44]ONI73495.1 hypothetical protein ALI144C_44055 [Actinosynnema sp. ALI-1.44]
MAKDKDPELLLSEALRAQAVQTGPPATPGFGLLSGDDLGLAARLQTQAMPDDEDPDAFMEPFPEPLPRRELSGWSVLLVAVALGLACGAVMGLLTVL